MFPWDRKRERFPYQANDFDSEIRKLQEELSKALQEGRDFSLGFSVVSVNGQPVEQRIFGQPQADTSDPQVDEIEPLVDIVNEKDHIKVLIDLPGVEKKDIKLTTEDDILEIRVDSESRKYHKKIELPHSVKNPTADYRNGVLEVKVKKDEPENVKIG